MFSKPVVILRFPYATTFSHSTLSRIIAVTFPKPTNKAFLLLIWLYLKNTRLNATDKKKEAEEGVQHFL